MDFLFFTKKAAAIITGVMQAAMIVNMVLYSIIPKWYARIVHAISFPETQPVIAMEHIIKVTFHDIFPALFHGLESNATNELNNAQDVDYIDNRGHDISERIWNNGD